MADNRAVMIREYMLDKDVFDKPKTIVNEEAIALLIVRIILLEPGTNPLFPTMGVGLVSRFRYTFEKDEEAIRRAITDQLETFLPDHQVTEINFVYNEDKTVNIEITIDDVTYIYDSSELVPLTLNDVKDI